MNKPPADAENPPSATNALLRIAVEYGDATPVIRMQGELDLSTLHLLHDAVDTVVTLSPRRRVVLDVSELAFCSVQGLESIYATKLRLESLGMRLFVTGASRRLRRLADLAGLGDLVGIPASIPRQVIGGRRIST